jgi:hypothetical protein
MADDQLEEIVNYDVRHLGRDAKHEKEKMGDNSPRDPAFLDQISQFYQREWKKSHNNGIFKNI